MNYVVGAPTVAAVTGARRCAGDLAQWHILVHIYPLTNVYRKPLARYFVCAFRHLFCVREQFRSSDVLGYSSERRPRCACASDVWFSRWNSCALISKHWHHYIDDYRFRQRDTWLLKIFYDWRKAVSVPSRLMRQCQHRRKNWVCLGRDIFNL